MSTRKPLFIVLGIALAAPAFGQELTEAQRRERCRTNAAAGEEIRGQIAEINRMINEKVTAKMSGHAEEGGELQDQLDNLGMAVRSGVVALKYRDPRNRRIEAHAF